MCGSATLATLVSSTSMKVASITVPAITQGFISGRAGLPAGVRSSTTSVCRALVISRSQRELLGENGRVDIHSWTQHLIAAGNGIEHDLHRNSLDHFDVVAS